MLVFVIPAQAGIQPVDIIFFYFFRKSRAKSAIRRSLKGSNKTRSSLKNHNSLSVGDKPKWSFQSITRLILIFSIRDSRKRDTIISKMIYK